MLVKILLIGAGGALGSVLRYGIGVASNSVSERTGLPLGTLAVNLLGCLLIGLAQGLLLERWVMRPEWRAAIIVGVLGGLTTFSSFGWEVAEMVREGERGGALVHAVLNNVLGVAMVFAGLALARQA